MPVAVLRDPVRCRFVRSDPVRSDSVRSNPVRSGFPGRSGVSLLEILIATSILFGAVVVLAELAQIGRRHAESTSERVVAQQLCQQKLHEIILGMAPLTAASAPLEDAPGWAYRVEVEPLQDFEELSDLVRVHVIVEQDPQAPEMARRRNFRSFRLTRWLRAGEATDFETPTNTPLTTAR